MFSRQRTVYYAIQGGFNVKSAIETLVCDQTKAIEQYFHVALFIMLYKVVM